MYVCRELTDLSYPSIAREFGNRDHTTVLHACQKVAALSGQDPLFRGKLKDLLADEGYDPTFGARPLKRVIQQRIENPLAQKILAGEFGPGDAIEINVFAFNAKIDIAGCKSGRVGAADAEHF